MKSSFAKILALTTLICGTAAQKILLANDDGWATANIREEYKELVAAGFEVILSASPVDRSGTGRSTATPTPMNVTCEFNTCPIGSPAIGTDPNDPNIHYVHAFPADAVRFGIQDFAQARWGGNPDFVVAGVNIGRNLGSTVFISGTDSAACEAANLGVPSFAFSGQSGRFVSYTTLETDPNAQSTIDAKIYTALVRKFLSGYLAGHSSDPSSRLVPAGTTVNINFSATNICNNNPDNFRFVATKSFSNTPGGDTERCGSRQLPLEQTVSDAGCFVTISVINSTTETNSRAAEQKAVFDKADSLLTCL
ncbi:hypothetical protein AGABI2DRAFT_193599 [Agaricus bisporus var. bisporus H97]|uniref:hypothetical protein n=1 Tax=Agaricus bisporus var. bisporus (strain H97 / ATCC MYA-4626 / FGSC 10389) TaxID=936046 RepID=UPI00029F7971|nr:hypothetical protein AGABI2DRAFT_193599 [Agaricus bisporus var. bisporus H97]EKV45640.1 hypothetical protein AGABI2DRAFT_193599 [Agaricus bisporus var. bisporus H97]